jgi:hypothetical protein
VAPRCWVLGMPRPCLAAAGSATGQRVDAAADVDAVGACLDSDEQNRQADHHSAIAHDVPAATIDRERQHMRTCQLGATRNRSIVGVMTEFARLAEVHHGAPLPTWSRSQSSWPGRPVGRCTTNTSARTVNWPPHRPWRPDPCAPSHASIRTRWAYDAIVSAASYPLRVVTPWSANATQCAGSASRWSGWLGRR